MTGLKHEIPQQTPIATIGSHSHRQSNPSNSLAITESKRLAKINGNNAWRQTDTHEVRRETTKDNKQLQEDDDIDDDVGKNRIDKDFEIESDDESNADDYILDDTDDTDKNDYDDIHTDDESLELETDDDINDYEFSFHHRSWRTKPGEYWSTTLSVE